MDAFEPHNLLFVYGALTRGMSRTRFLSKEKTRFLCPATANGTLYAIGDFPGLVVYHPTVNSLAVDSSASIRVEDGSSRPRLPTTAAVPKSPHENGRRVHGELFEIFDPLTFFDTLDVIEGYWPDQIERSLFVRKLIPVETENGATTAWAYILNLPANGTSRFDPGE
ncbi:MAG: gamma-glutamylcyclotransferase family protein [bacterium]